MDTNDSREQQAEEEPVNADLPEITEKPAGKKTEPSGRMELYDWVQCIVTALIFGILLFVFVLRVVSVVGTSMYPTLCNGDRIITSNLFYTPKDGDIVVVKKASFGDEPIVKRVIATAGQTVDIDFSTGIVYVDGEALDEPYTAAPTITQEDFSGPVTVPEGCVFLMGDNRNDSTDSRSSRIGMVDTRCIIGKVYLILYPGENKSGVREFSRIGSAY